jgi:hypothetical protein
VGRIRALLPALAVAAVVAAVALVVDRHSPAHNPPQAALVVAVPTPFDAEFCSPHLLSLRGSLDDCIYALAAQSCTQRSTFEAITLLHGVGGAYLLYVEIDGGFNGPATYRLAPWPHHALDVGDDAPKVALRVFGSGELFESAGGVLTIDEGGWSGTVAATLRYSGTSSPPPAAVTLTGNWTCLP